MAEEVEEPLSAPPSFSEPEEATEAPQRNICCRRKLGKRYILCFLIHIGFASTYMHRVNLNIVLVMLVNNTLHGEVDTPYPVIQNESVCVFKGSGAETKEKLSVDGLHSYPWSKSTQGLILSSYFWLYALPLIPAANGLQAVSPTKMFAFGFAAPGVLALFLPLAIQYSVYMLMFVRALQGLFESFVCPSAAALLSRWIPNNEKTFLFNFCIMGSLVGTIIASFSSGPMAKSVLGWQSVFYIQGAMSIAWLVPFLWLVRDSPAICPRTPLKEWQLILGREPFPWELEARSKGEIPEERKMPAVPWRAILSDRAVWVFVLCMGVRDWLFNTNLACVPQFASEVLKYSVDKTSMVMGMLFLSNLVLPMTISFAADRIINATHRRGLVRKLCTGLGMGGAFISLLMISRTGCNSKAVLVWLLLSNIVISFCSGGFIPSPVDLTVIFSGAIFSLSNILSTISCIASPIAADELTPTGSLEEWGHVFDIGGSLALITGTLFICFSASSSRRWSPELMEEEIEPEALNEPLLTPQSSYGSICETNSEAIRS